MMIVRMQCVAQENCTAPDNANRVIVQKMIGATNKKKNEKHFHLYVNLVQMFEMLTVRAFVVSKQSNLLKQKIKQCHNSCVWNI